MQLFKKNKTNDFLSGIPQVERMRVFLSMRPLIAERIRMVDERLAGQGLQQLKALKPVRFGLKDFQRRLAQEAH